MTGTLHNRMYYIKIDYTFRTIGVLDVINVKKYITIIFVIKLI